MPKIDARRHTLYQDHYDYTPDEIEFMMAMDKYKREKRRPFPQWSEVMGVFLSLGYRKPELPTVLPR